MKDEHKRFIEGILQYYNFVMWDRFIDKGDTYTVYGWIERKDAYKDFLVLHINPTKQVIDFVTSSPEHHKLIVQPLSTELKNLRLCQRVEYNFTVNNCIKLKK